MRNKIKYFLWSLLALIAASGLFFSVSSPLRYRNQIHKITLSDSLLISNFLPVFYNPLLKPLIKEQAYKQALLQMAGLDSIGLSIDLSDSTAKLTLKGVEIHSSAISDFSIDPVLKGIRLNDYQKIFSKPLTKVGFYSSLMKDPIVVKKAPKTPEEALAMATLPDSIPTEPAYFWLELDYGIRLIIVQDQWNGQKENQMKRKYIGDLRKLKRKNFIKSFLKPAQVSYTPTIVIKTKATEVRAIYRALPHNAKVVTRLP